MPDVIETIKIDVDNQQRKINDLEIKVEKLSKDKNLISKTVIAIFRQRFRLPKISQDAKDFWTFLGAIAVILAFIFGIVLSGIYILGYKERMGSLGRTSQCVRACQYRNLNMFTNTRDSCTCVDENTGRMGRFTEDYTTWNPQSVPRLEFREYQNE